jgi:hypothetical protein
VLGLFLSLPTVSQIGHVPSVVIFHDRVGPGGGRKCGGFGRSITPRTRAVPTRRQCCGRSQNSEFHLAATGTHRTSMSASVWTGLRAEPSAQSSSTGGPPAAQGAVRPVTALGIVLTQNDRFGQVRLYRPILRRPCDPRGQLIDRLHSNRPCPVVVILRGRMGPGSWTC